MIKLQFLPPVLTSRRGRHHLRHRLARPAFFLVVALAALLVAFLVASRASAEAANQDWPVTPNDVNRVARQLYCPVCPNTPLDVCETQACSDWRELIRTKLAAGASDQQIIDYFVAQYGQRVLAQPPARGFNLLVWIIPLIFLLAAAGGLALILKRWSGKRTKAAPQTAVFAVPQGLPPDYVARVERELRSRRQ